MSTAQIISEIVSLIADRNEEWGGVIIKHDGYTFHVYYDAAFDALEIEQVIYNVVSGEQRFIEELPEWFEKDVFRSVILKIMKLRHEEIKAEREIQAMDRNRMRQVIENKNKIEITWK